ncbi:hypothetical protein GCM10023149_29010 [Mucilaginibacter gynuensis]|uniref:N-acetyltransferase domain-containing protein n=1 Tax=Mucilaginibacter gynuensis TaxID=1302236 RepID=A0ABP8GKZ5_9SPHI
MRETHKFLAEEDITFYKHLISYNLLEELDLYYIEENGVIWGFIGISGEALEMLFIDPQYFNKGYGRMLINFAIDKGVTRVDVNEQNPKALGFYLHMGFQIISRHLTDGAGKPYPVLELRRNTEH